MKVFLLTEETIPDLCRNLRLTGDLDRDDNTLYRLEQVIHEVQEAIRLKKAIRAKNREKR